MRSAELIRHGRFDEIDRESLADEIEGMGKSKRCELFRLLGQAFASIIKYEYLSDTDPDTISRWRKDAEVFHENGMNVLKKNPGLKGNIPEILDESWNMARSEVYRSFPQFVKKCDLDKIGIPQHCPWTIEQVLSGEILPEGPDDQSNPFAKLRP